MLMNNKQKSTFFSPNEDNLLSIVICVKYITKSNITYQYIVTSHNNKSIKLSNVEQS